MSKRFDRAWADAVCEVCDPIFDAADVAFERQVHVEGGLVTALLWEADPKLVAERYADSGIVESYGCQWPPPCIDYWVYVDGQAASAQTSTEGWRPDQDVALTLTGDGRRDGIAIGTVMARILRTQPPPRPTRLQRNDRSCR